MARQRTFVLPVHRLTALVDVAAARMALGVDAESVTALVECGQLRWCFDIAAPGARSRREVRIWARCLDPQAAAVETWEAALTGILGTPRGTVHGSELERIFLCSATHVKLLHDCGELAGELVGHTRHIRWDSAAEFLRRRRI